MEKVQAVNDMLQACGLSPINSLEGNTNVGVLTCIKVLEHCDREIQSRGWWFNTFNNVKLQPNNIDNKIYWNDTWIKIKSMQGYFNKRGKYVFDVENHTDEFKDSITVDTVNLIEFSDIPFVMIDYIVARSSRIYQARFVSDPFLAEALLQEEQENYMRVMEYDIEMTAPNEQQGQRYITNMQRR